MMFWVGFGIMLAAIAVGFGLIWMGINLKPLKGADKNAWSGKPMEGGGR